MKCDKFQFGMPGSWMVSEMFNYPSLQLLASACVSPSDGCEDNGGFEINLLGGSK